MKLKLMLLLLVSFTVSSQEFMTYKDLKQYKATDNWTFICENYALTGIVNVQIAKNDTSGILKLAAETTNPSFNIAGTVYVYLSDNTIITCLDKGVFDNKETKIISYYTFSNIEMNKLKTTDIQSIRFNIKGNGNSFSSQTGNFTAVNKKSYFATAFDKTKKNHETANEITQLYN